MMVFGLAVFGPGVGQIMSGQIRIRADSRLANRTTVVTQTPGFTRAETVAIVLAVIEVVLGAMVLL
jgi:hypothetical protein